MDEITKKVKSELFFGYEYELTHRDERKEEIREILEELADTKD